MRKIKTVNKKKEREAIEKSIALLTKAHEEGGTPYKIAMGTKLAELTIKNYLKGKTRPKISNAEVLIKYFESGSFTSQENIKSRILKFIENKGISVPAFEKKAKLPSGYVDKIDMRIRRSQLKKISDSFPELSAGWILSGEGEMIHSLPTAAKEVTPMPKADANKPSPIAAEPISERIKHKDIVETRDVQPKSAMPFVDALATDRCIQVTDSSMEPICPLGSTLLIREVANWKDYLGYGGIFHIKLKDGRSIIKEIAKYDPNPKDYFLCVSRNKEIPTEELPKTFISSIWKVISILTNRGW